ncbi:hypothetical protein CB1_002312012 [Camelus ferus]|nr:hypothetical protein CB1_002312012 [Camelus ferus]
MIFLLIEEDKVWFGRIAYQRNDDDEEEAARERRRRARQERLRQKQEEESLGQMTDQVEVNTQNSVPDEEVKTATTNTQVEGDEEAALLERLARREERRQKRLQEALERQKEFDPTVTDASLSLPSRRMQNNMAENESAEKEEKSESRQERYEIEETEIVTKSHQKNDWGNAEEKKKEEKEKEEEEEEKPKPVSSEETQIKDEKTKKDKERKEEVKSFLDGKKGFTEVKSQNGEFMTHKLKHTENTFRQKRANRQHTFVVRSLAIVLEILSQQEEKRRLKEEIERRRAEAAEKRQKMPEDGLSDDKKPFKCFTPKGSSLKIEERAEFLNKSVQKSSGVKSTHQAAVVSKIDSRLEQYTSAIEGTKTAKPAKPAASDLPVPAEGVRNIKSMWEKGSVFSSPSAPGAPNKETAGLKVGVSSRINEWLTKTPDGNKSPAPKPSDLRPGDVSGKRNLWEKQSVDKVTSPTKDEDTFMKFVSEDIHQCALLTADSISDPFFPRTTQILLEYQLGRWVPRLRKPRDLYGVSSSGPLSPTRWPYHCEVIDEKVQHIDWTPSYPEPVYIPTGLEMEPLYPNSKEDTVVYLAEDAYKEPCFVYSRVGGNRTPLKQPVDNYDDTLMFEARFESGNLQKVVKVAEYEYQLTVRPDLFTNRHTQWYYFQVTNTQAGIVYRFTIINFTKPASLYNRGMRPLFYSEKEANTHNIGWQRIGDQIKYYRNNQGQDGRHCFSLTWTFQFPHNKDTCYFAHCYPYTYTNLQEYLSSINNDPVRSKFCKIRVLCHTIARNMVYVLTITSPLKNTDTRKRKAVILTARVHPGETNSSWIIKGFLDYILGDSSDAQLLRDTFIFKVVPMLNPDGVIVGNYRCSLAGQDLNRNYTSLLKESYPSVWYTRNMIRR